MQQARCSLSSGFVSAISGVKSAAEDGIDQEEREHNEADDLMCSRHLFRLTKEFQQRASNFLPRGQLSTTYLVIIRPPVDPDPDPGHSRDPADDLPCLEHPRHLEQMENNHARREQPEKANQQNYPVDSSDQILLARILLPHLRRIRLLLLAQHGDMGCPDSISQVHPEPAVLFMIPHRLRRVIAPQIAFRPYGVDERRMGVADIQRATGPAPAVRALPVEEDRSGHGVDARPGKGLDVEIRGEVGLDGGCGESGAKGYVRAGCVLVDEKYQGACHGGFAEADGGPCVDEASSEGEVEVSRLFSGDVDAEGETVGFRDEDGLAGDGLRYGVAGPYTQNLEWSAR